MPDFCIVDANGKVLNVIVADDLATAEAVIAAHEGAAAAHAHGGEAGIGWTTPDGGQTWTDTRPIHTRTVEPTVPGA